MQLLDYTKEAIITCNADGSIAYANKTALIIFGYSDSSIIGQDMIDIISKNNYYDVKTKILSASNNSLIQDVILLKKNGTEFHASIRVIHTDGTLAIYITDLTYRYEFRKEISDKVKIIEQLGKSSVIRKGNLTDAISEILDKSTEALMVSRVNIWLNDENISKIECLGSIRINETGKHLNESKGVILTEQQLPKYFKMLQTEEVIVTDDVLKEPQTSELVHSYLVPNGITSMMDFPLRSNGKMIGVVCFEHTGSMRKWTVFEIKFGVLIAQLLSLLLEGYEKSKLIRKQVRYVKEKEALLNESNNRAKYIFSLMNTVLAVDEKLCRDDYHRNLFLQIKNNLLNISGVYEIMISSQDMSNINMEKKILRLIGYMHQIYPDMGMVDIDLKVNNVKLQISQAVSVGLIINQLIQISYEQSFKESKQGKISLYIHTNNGQQCIITYKDDGVSLNENQINGHLIELRLAELFTEEMNGKFNIVVGNGNKFSISFPLMEPSGLEVAVN